MRFHITSREKQFSSHINLKYSFHYDVNWSRQVCVVHCCLNKPLHIFVVAVDKLTDKNIKNWKTKSS